MNNAFAVSHQVIESAEYKKLPPATKLLYIYLSKLSNRYADKSGWFWVSNKTLADEMNIDIRNVIRAKKILQETGFLKYQTTTFKNSSLKATLYRLNHFMDISKYGG